MSVFKQFLITKYIIKKTCISSRFLCFMKVTFSMCPREFIEMLVITENNSRGLLSLRETVSKVQSGQHRATMVGFELWRSHLPFYFAIFIHGFYFQLSLLSESWYGCPAYHLWVPDSKQEEAGMKKRSPAFEEVISFFLVTKASSIF